MSHTTAHTELLPHAILVAVDSGVMTDAAVEQALELGRVFGAKVELLHAISSPVPSLSIVPDPYAVSAGTDLVSRAREHVVAHLEGVLGSGPGAAVRADRLLRVEAGRPSRVLLDRARESGADLIVLGALRRRAGIDFGSTARTILAKATCPVWVQPGPVSAISRILVPVDLSDESLIAMATACAWARRFGASVTAVHVFDVPTLATAAWAGYATAVDEVRRASLEAFEKAMKAFDWHGVEHEHSFVDGLPAAEILERAKTADLVVMGTHGRGGVAAVLLGSTAYSVLKSATRPVMVVRKPGREFEG